MKNKLCILLAFVNLISIGGIVYYTSYAYLNTYNTVLFWGMNLYVLTASCIMLANEKNFSTMIPINFGITILAIYWFFNFLPQYKPEEALSHVKNLDILPGYTYKLDTQHPVQPVNMNQFIKGVYRIRASGPEDYIIYVNPKTGNYELAPLKDDIKKGPFMPVETENELDKSFKTAWSNAKSDSASLSFVLIQYSNLWKKEMKRQLNLLLALCSEENKALLLKDQETWEQYFKTHQTMQLKLYAQQYDEGEMMEILKEDIPYHLYRERALQLQNSYKKLNKEVHSAKNGNY